MGTRYRLDLLHDIGVTGVAGRLYVAGKNYIQRLVRILMAGKAVLQREMGLAFMTVGALGNQRTFFRSRGMGAGMTFKAGNLGFVLCTGLIDLLHKRGMAFFAVFIAELGAAKSRIGRISIDDKSRDCETEQGSCGEQDRASHFSPLTQEFQRY